MQSVIVHIINDDPILGEVDHLPEPSDTNIILKNARKRDGKDLTYVDANVRSIIWPMVRINFIEILTGDEDESIITHVRE